MRWTGLVFILTGLALMAPWTCPAGESTDDLGLILDGFDSATDPFPAGQAPPDTGPESPLQIYAVTEILSGVWLRDVRTPTFREDALDAATLDATLEITLEYTPPGWTFFADADLSHDLAPFINGRSGHQDAYIDDREKNAELKELWMEKNLTPFFDIKAGRQIVSWGVSNTLRVVDVLNPLDNRRPGLTDIEDRRLPAVMTRVNLYSEKIDASLIAVHEVRADKSPAYGSPFYVPEVHGTGVETKNTSPGNTQFGLAVNRRFRGMDTGFFAAGFFDHSPWTDPATGRAGDAPFVKMAGAACTLARGNLLYKAETAYFSGKKYSNARDPEKDRADLLAGLEYTGFTDTTVTAELCLRRILDFEAPMEARGYEENQVSAALRIEREFFNDTLTLSLLSSVSGLEMENGGFSRLKADYDHTDTLRFEAGCVLYHGGDSRFYDTIEHNHTLFFKLVFDINGP